MGDETVLPADDAVFDAGRLAALAALELLDGPEDPVLQRVSRLATRLLDAPVSLVSLVDVDRQFFAAGADVLPEPWATARETPFSHSFCRHVVSDDDPLIVDDAENDDRVADNRAIEDLGVRAYAGLPLRTDDGHVLGSFCVIHDEPHAWTEDELQVLSDLRDVVMSELTLRAVELRAADRAPSGQAFVGIARDLRGLAVAIRSTARTMRTLTFDDATARHGLASVLDGQSDRVVGLLDQLLDTVGTDVGGGAADR